MLYTTPGTASITGSTDLKTVIHLGDSMNQSFIMIKHSVRRVLMSVAASIGLVATSSVTAQIAFESVATAEAENGATFTIPAPTGIQIDDLLLASIAVEGAQNGDDNTGPAGWTELSDVAEDRDVSLSMYYRVATLADTTAVSYTFTIDSNEARVGSILRYSGIDASNPIVAHNGAATGTSQSAIAPSVSTGTVANTMVVRSVGHEWGFSSQPPAGHTERADQRYTLDPGDQFYVLVANADQTQVAAGLTGTATFTNNTFENDNGYVAATTVLRPIPEPIFTVDKETTTASIDQGQQATYTITFSNAGLDTASSDVRVTDTLPSDFTFASASFSSTGAATGPGGGASGALTNNGTAAVPVFDGFTVPNGDSVTITMIVDVPTNQAVGTFDNQATVSSIGTNFADASDDGAAETDEDVTVSCLASNIANTATVSIGITDIDPTNNTDSFCVAVRPDPQLIVNKQANTTDPVRRGQQLVYTLSITNTGTPANNANDVELNDVLPAGLTWVSTTNSNGGGTCTVGNLAACNCSAPGNTGTVTCQMGTVTPGQTQNVVITTTVD